MFAMAFSENSGYWMAKTIIVIVCSKLKFANIKITGLAASISNFQSYVLNTHPGTSIRQTTIVMHIIKFFHLSEDKIYRLETNMYNKFLMLTIVTSSDTILT